MTLPLHRVDLFAAAFLASGRTPAPVTPGVPPTDTETMAWAWSQAKKMTAARCGVLGHDLVGLDSTTNNRLCAHCSHSEPQPPLVTTP